MDQGFERFDEIDEVKQDPPAAVVFAAELPARRSPSPPKNRVLTLVLKVGSSSLANGKFPALAAISRLVETICELRRAGHNVVLVTSGAVSVGCHCLKLKERPKNLVTKQAVAAVGQGRLMRMYDDLFSQLEQPVAQVLLSRENLSKNHHYNNAVNTFDELLRLGVVPIVNENDTVAVEELRFGDNDTLSALVASLVRADFLFLLTDIDALYTGNPKTDPEAKPIRVVDKIEDLKVDVSSGQGSQWGTGGMETKIQAARIATRAGVRTAILKSTATENIQLILDGCREVGTVFEPQGRPIKGKKKWIAHGIRPSGTLFLDEGAVKSVLDKHSLFAAGVKSVEGKFSAHDAVILRDGDGIEIGRGLANFTSDEIEKIKGHTSKEFEALLGYPAANEVVDRDNLALTRV